MRLLDRHTRAKVSIAWHFFAGGALSGNWVSLIPSVKDELGLDNAELGGVMVACLLGSIVALPVMPWATRRWGSGALSVAGVVLSLAVFPLAGAFDVPLFVLGAFLLGVGLGIADVAINVQAVLCETVTALPTTGLFHGMYAVGSVVGALIGGGLLQLGMSVLEEAVTFPAVMVVPQLLLSFWLYYKKEEDKLVAEEEENKEGETAPKGAIEIELSEREQTETINPITSPLITQQSTEVDEELAVHGDLPKTQITEVPKDNNSIEDNNNIQDDEEVFKQELTKEERMTLIHIASLSFLGYLGYGSIVDWSTIYLSEDIGCDSLRSTLGFVGFSVCIAAGTFSSDWLAMHIGRRVLLQCAGVIAAAGLVIAVLAKSFSDKDLALSCAIIGFSICGAGISAVSPSVISLAGSCFRGASSSEAITFVSSAGYVGMMAGPPLLGGISAVVGDLRWSLAMDAVLMLLISLLASCLRFITLSDRNSLNNGAR